MLPNFLGTATVYVNFLLIKAIDRSPSTEGSYRGYKRGVHVDVVGEVDRRVEFDQLIRFAWKELQAATENFNEKNVIRQGGFVKVYEGVLRDNTKVAGNDQQIMKVLIEMLFSSARWR